MKHQITLLGGQVTPVYWGIKEREPDIVHLLYSVESRFHVPILIGLFPLKKFKPVQVSPYSFDEIKSVVEAIIFENPDDLYELNLTGGTKVMALACNNIFKTLDYNSFYIDQNNRIYDFNNHSYTPITSKINTKLFLSLSGHKDFISKTTSDYSTTELIFANQVELFSETKEFCKIIRLLKSNKVDTAKTLKYSLIDESFHLSWNSPNLEIKTPSSELTCVSTNAFRIAFNGLWWELLVADAIRKWPKIFELKLGVEIHSKTERGEIKNEIDIMINTGFNLIFIECKSGDVIQADINKIKVVKRLYGGLSSRSILIAKYPPRKAVIEKCQDLGIDLFYIPNLNGIVPKLEQVLKKYEL